MTKKEERLFQTIDLDSMDMELENDDNIKTNVIRLDTKDDISNKTLSISSLIPTDYYKNTDVMDLVKNIAKLDEEAVFYIFYNFPETELQIMSYKKLIEMGYRYSETIKAFVFLYGNYEIDNKSREIICFDITKWKRTTITICFNKEFYLGLKGMDDLNS